MLLTKDQSDVATHSAGQGHALQTSLSEARTGLSPDRQAESNTVMVSEDTCCWQMTLRVRVPKPQVLEHDVQSVMCHL